MVKRCSIISCKNEFIPGRGITYHAFPTKDTELKKKWIDTIPDGLINEVTATKFICSLHFLSENYFNTPSGRNFLKKDAIPTRFEILPNVKPKKNDKIMITNINVTVDQRDKLKRCAEYNMADDIENIRIKDNDNTPLEITRNKCDASTQTSSKRSKPTPRMDTLMNKVDNLQKRLRRRDAKISIMKEIIKTLKEN